MILEQLSDDTKDWMNYDGYEYFMCRLGCHVTFTVVLSIAVYAELSVLQVIFHKIIFCRAWMGILL